MVNKFDSLESLEVNQNVIRCPHCGQEYLAAELFMPEDLFGAPTNIVKTSDGKVDFFLGERPTFETEYCCDNCDTTFRVRAKLSFESFIDDKDNFDEEYVSKLKVNIFENEVNLFDEDPAKDK